MIAFGPLDRPGKLYRRVPSVGEGGAVVYTLTFLRNFNATQLPPTRRTPDAEQASVGGRTAAVGMPVYRTRSIPELTTGMLIVIDRRSFLAVRADELGRREGWDIYMEDVR